MKKFIFFENYVDAIETIEDEGDRLAAYEALFKYFRDEAMPEDLSGVVKTVIQALSPCIERTIGLHRTRAEAGKRGGDRGRGGNPNFKKGQPNPYRSKPVEKTDEDDCPFPVVEEIGDGDKSADSLSSQSEEGKHAVSVGEESRAFEHETYLRPLDDPFGGFELAEAEGAKGDMDKMEAFLDKHKIVRDYCGYELSLIDWDKFQRMWESSNYLSHAPIATSLKWLARNYKAILGGCYGNENDPKRARRPGRVSEQEAVEGNPFADVAEEGDDGR